MAAQSAMVLLDSESGYSPVIGEYLRDSGHRILRLVRPAPSPSTISLTYIAQFRNTDIFSFVRRFGLRRYGNSPIQFVITAAARQCARSNNRPLEIVGAVTPAGAKSLLRSGLSELARAGGGRILALISHPKGENACEHSQQDEKNVAEVTATMAARLRSHNVEVYSVLVDLPSCLPQHDVISGHTKGQVQPNWRASKYGQTITNVGVIASEIFCGNLRQLSGITALIDRDGISISRVPTSLSANGEDSEEESAFPGYDQAPLLLANG